MPPDLARTLLLGLFAILVLAAAVKDLTSYTIPNWVSAALGLTFAPAALMLGVSPGAIGATLAMGAVILACGVAMFALGWIGGGDAKLLAAVSLWIGLAGLPRLLVFTGLAGGILALVLLALRSPWLRGAMTAAPGWARRLAAPGAEAPYGVAIAAGAMAAFPGGLIMHLAHGHP